MISTTEDPRAKHALADVLRQRFRAFHPFAFDLQGYVYNRVMFNALISRLGEAIVGEITLDEAYERMEADVAKEIAEKKRQ